MQRRVLYILASLACSLAIGVGVETIGRPTGHESIYTVAEVRAHLTEDPNDWVGRAVLVRGVAENCLAASNPPRILNCSRWPPDLADPGSVGASTPLPLAWGEPNPLATLVRQIPLLGRLVLPPPSPHWWVAATYRVRLRAAPALTCGAAPCYEALLLRVVPGTATGHQ